MKKILSVLLCAVMLLGCCSFAGFAAQDDFTLIVASDLHYDSTNSSRPITKKNNMSEDFAHAYSGGQLHAESLAIIDAFFAEGAPLGDCILLPGDLIVRGDTEEHTLFAAMLKGYEEKYGKPIYVVPGNHDYYKVTVDEFKALYADFGYSEALEKDTLTASYTADLGGDYRLIVIDSCIPGKNEAGVTKELVEWIKQQGEKAKKDEKFLVASMHHNLDEHFPLDNDIHEGAVVDKNLGLLEVLAEAGIKYIFTGHSHEHDILACTAKDGEVIYDVVTGSLTMAPCPYRVVSFGNEVTFKTNKVSKVNTALVPEGMSENAFELLENDFQDYAKQYSFVGLKSLLTSYTSASTLKGMFDTDSIDDPEVKAIFDGVAEKLAECFDVSIYLKNETNGISIERLLAKFEVSLPETDYNTLLEILTAIYMQHICGDEDIPIYSDEILIFSRGLAASLSYATSDLTDEDYAMVLSYIGKKLDIKTPDIFTDYVASELRRYQGSELLVSTSIVPLIISYANDTYPNDSNVTLPGYTQLVEPERELSFLERISEFFRKIFDFFMSLFSF